MLTLDIDWSIEDIVIEPEDIGLQFVDNRCIIYSMTVIPAKHTFTIWQGATFFEVLTLYETMDKNTPRDFCEQNSPSNLVSNITVTTASDNTVSATLNGAGVSSLLPNNTYSISSTTIPAANNISFTTGAGPFSSSYNITLSSGTGVTTGTTVAATINKRTLIYYAEMVIRDKPQGTPIHALRSVNNPDYNSNTDSLIEFSLDPATKGQIRLIISSDTTVNFGSSSSWKTGVYDLTISNSTQSPVITDALLYGGIKVNGV